MPQHLNCRSFATSMLVILVVLLASSLWAQGHLTTLGSYPLRAMSLLVADLPAHSALPTGWGVGLDLGLTQPKASRPQADSRLSKEDIQLLEQLESLENAINDVISANPEVYSGISNPILQETLALLRYPRYGNASSPAQNLLWSGAAGVPADETLALTSHPVVAALQGKKSLWHSDFIHLLAVLDTYVSRELTPRANPNGRIMSFGGDLLTASLSETVDASALGTEASGYFGRQDLMADLHGTLLAILWDTYPTDQLKDLRLSQLLRAYAHHYQPSSSTWRLQWTIALSSHFDSIEALCDSIADELGLDPTTDPETARRLEALRLRLYGL